MTSRPSIPSGGPVRVVRRASARAPAGTWLLALAWLVACEDPWAARPPQAPAVAVGSAVAPGGPDATSSASASPTEADPDTDGDGIPDRCDACPRQPGMLWDGFPVIDGCSTGEFHSLVRRPEGQVLNIVYSDGSTAPPPRDDLPRVVEILARPSVGSILVVGRARPAEPRHDSLARERARRMYEALKAGGVTAEMTWIAAIGTLPGVEIGVLSSDRNEVLRFVDNQFEHVDLAAWQERRKKAEGAPSPCGRWPGG